MSAYTTTLDIRFNDVDGLGHVNNARYLTFFEHARMKFFTQEAGGETEKDFPFILAHAAVDYKKPMKMDVTINIKMWTSRIGGKSWDFEYEITDEKNHEVYATGKTVQVAYDYFLQKSDMLEGRLKDLIKSLMP